jgi:Nucleotide-diphospho-sugar transferase
MTSEPLTITFVDANYLPLLEIWLPRLRELGVGRVKVFCLDPATLEWCRSAGVACAPVEWSGNLRDLWVQRIRIFSALLAAGEEFVHSDIDAIWIRNPLREGSACGRQEDLLFSQGTVWPPDVHDKWGFVLCCGWFRVRPTQAAQAFFQGLEADVRSSGDDQVSVNRLLALLGVDWSQGRTGDYQLVFRDRLVQCWSQPIHATTATGSLSVALLPHREFQRLPEDSAHTLVKHYLTPKNCAQKLSALQAYGLI